MIVCILQDSSVRKAALLVHYVDLHNDYVLDARKSKVKFLELFQAFRYKIQTCVCNYVHDITVTISCQNSQI